MGVTLFNLSIRSIKVGREVKRRGGGGFNKICSLSTQLQKVVGAPELARTEVHPIYLLFCADYR